MTNYKGLQHFPLGNAILENVGENLLVSNMSSCGDGFSVKTPNIADWEVSISPFQLATGQGISYSLIGKDGFSRLETIGQASIFINANGQGAIAVNSKLMASKIKLTAKLNGQTSFTSVFDNPSCNCSEIRNTHENWLPVAIAIATLVVAAVDYKKETKKDANGKVIEETTTVSFGGAGRAAYQDPLGNEFEADHIFIESTFRFDPSIEAVFEQHPNEVQLMFCNIAQVTLTNEIY